MPGLGMVSSSLHALDEELAVRARNAAAWRLRVGQVLEALARLELFFQLGFSSLAAYALERCERSGRWVEAARCVARRLEGLPSLRRALATGQVSWSVAELVSGVASTEDEAHWLLLAQRHTVRELRQQVQAVRRTAQESPDAGVASASPSGGHGLEPSSAPSPEPAEPFEDELCVLTCTVNTEDAWLFEATQTLLEHLGTHGHGAQLEALLAEGQDLLLSALPREALPLELESEAAARRRRGEQLARWQKEAEERSERPLRSVLLQRLPPRLNEVSSAAAAGLSSLYGLSAHELDGEMRTLSRAVARQELEMAQLMLRFHRTNGWRALGYVSEAQYARERLGISRSSLLARRALALRLEALPAVADALGSAQIGVEAAQQVVRIATPRTMRAWLERARVRTIKHLREEVSAALIAVRVSGEVDCPPPADAELEAYAELQRAVISGRACEPASLRSPRRATSCLRVPPEAQSRRAWLIMLISLERWLSRGLMGDLHAEAAMPSTRGNGQPSGVQTSAQRALSSGRMLLRWRVSRDIYDWWHSLHARARSWLRPGVSWLRFLCLAFWQAWRHVLGAPVEYGGIYLRDSYRCRSPVCNRRDVTPHHLRFRSQGGGDEPQNVASVCSWCHLFGIHGGRIRAEGTADCIHWELGPVGRPCVIVHGRERVAA